MNQNQVEEKVLINYNQLEERYSIKKGTAYALVSQKRIPHVRLGNRFVLFEVCEIDKWLSGFVVKSETEGRAVT